MGGVSLQFSNPEDSPHPGLLVSLPSPHPRSSNSPMDKQKGTSCQNDAAKTALPKFVTHSPLDGSSFFYLTRYSGDEDDPNAGQRGTLPPFFALCESIGIGVELTTFILFL